MKILRKSMYPPTKEVGPPATMVIRECDLKEGVSIEIAASDAEGPHDVFILNDIFEIPGEPEIIQASLEAMKRQQSHDEEEWNMSILFYWNAMYLEKLVAGGTIAGQRQAPLRKEQIEYTFKRLVRHPNYKKQTMMSFSNDGYIVTAKVGAVTSTKAEK